MATLLCGFSPLGGGAAPPEIASSACHRDDYVLELRLWQAQGAVLATVGIVTDRAPACTLETTVRLTIRHRDRAIARGVRGNPAVWRIATPLAPWSQLVAYLELAQLVSPGATLRRDGRRGWEADLGQSLDTAAVSK